MLVVGQDMDHSFALFCLFPIDRIQVAQDVHQGAPALLALEHTQFQGILLLYQARIFVLQAFQGHLCIQSGFWYSLLSYVHVYFPRRTLSSSRFRFSISFSSAIILSSRPTTTSSNFSRSRIFSCSSALDSCRSRTTFSYARISRRIPIAPITRPSVSRRAEAFRVVGMTSSLALRGCSRA